VNHSAKARALELIRDHVRALGLPTGPPPTDADYAALEREFGVPVPLPIREVLSVFNGGVLEIGTCFGVRPGDQATDLTHFLRIWPEMVVRGCWPLASDGCGNYYVAGAEQDGQHSVAFWESSGTDPLEYMVASGVWHFEAFLFEKAEWIRRHPWPDDPPWDARWPFDKAWVLARDPGIVNCKRAPLPWDVD
jgi:hypothetical protein